MTDAPDRLLVCIAPPPSTPSSPCFLALTASRPPPPPPTVLFSPCPPAPSLFISHPIAAGAYTSAVHGVTMEAGYFTVPSNRVDRAGSLSGNTFTPSNTYATPVVVGQVASANSPRFQAFFGCVSARGARVPRRACSAGMSLCGSSPALLQPRRRWCRGAPTLHFAASATVPTSARACVPACVRVGRV